MVHMAADVWSDFPKTQMPVEVPHADLRGKEGKEFDFTLQILMEERREFWKKKNPELMS